MTAHALSDRRFGLGKLGLVLSLVAALLFSAAPAQADAVYISEQPINGWDTNGTVFAVKIVGNIAYIGGDFSLVRSPLSGSQTRNNVAAINMSSGAITSFRADTNSIVRAIDGDGAHLWIGGQFTSIGGQSRNRIASVNTSSGAVRSGITTTVNGTVYEIKRHGADVYLGGAFTNVNGVGRNRIVRVSNSNGSLDTGWNPNANATVRGLAVPDDGSVVYVGGSFTSIAGGSNPYVVGLSPTTGAVISPTWGNLHYPVLDLDVTPSGDRLMGAVAGLGNRVTVWNASTGSQSFRILVQGDTQAVKYMAGNVYFGFHDGYQDNMNAKIMSADIYTGAIEPWQPSISAFWGVWDIDATAAGLVAGGPFTSAEGVPTRGVAIFPALTGLDITPPTQPQNFVQTDSTATTISLEWDPSTDDTGVTTYTVIRDGLAVATTVDPMFTDLGLLPGAQYSYEVTAGDAASNTSPPAGPLLLSTGDAFVAAGAVWSYLDNGSNQGTGWRQQGFNASAWPTGNAELGFGDGGEATVISSGSITYYFVRDFAVEGALLEDPTLLIKRDDGVVIYINGVEAYRDNMPGGTINSSTTASLTISGLDEASFNEATIPASLLSIGSNRIAVEVHQRSTGSSDVSFDMALYGETVADLTPPSIPQNPQATEVLFDSITLQWNASTDDVELSHYEVTRDGTPIATTTALTHTDTTVDPETEYAYTIEAFDVAGNPSGASATVLLTTPSADSTAPSVPTGVVVDSTTETTVNLSWNPSTDATGVVGYTVRRDGVIVGTPAAPSFQDIDLDPDTTYSYTIDAFDAVPNTSAETLPIDATTLAPDTTAPSVPTGLIVTGSTATTIDLTWNPSTDDRGVTNYIVRRDGGVVGNVAVPGFTDTDLVPGMGYSYTVEAEDAVPNPSGQTAPIPGMTTPDNDAPSVPGSLQVTGTTESTADLSWTPSTDDVGLDEYVVYRDGIPIGTTSASTFSDGGLAWSTLYMYEVTAKDVAGNESGPAGPVPATTEDNIVDIDLVLEGATWKYLDDGSNLGTAWQSLGYADGGWDSGPAQLGFGDGDEDTVLQRGFITYYFRNTFEVDGDVQGDATLRVLRDDAVAVHINGVEVYTNNLPGSYNYLTGSTRTVAGGNERTFLTTDVPASVFTQGTNVIAVEIHQRNLNSSDISFDLSLEAEVALVVPDDTAPSVPSGLAVSNETLDGLTLSWDPSTDDVGVALYVIRRNGGIIGSTASTSFDDSSLASATTYAYTVAAQDGVGNTSAQSDPINGTTLAPDSEPPSDPTGLSVDAQTRTTADISWTASTDNVGVSGYAIRVDGVIDGTTTATSYVITGLSAGTTYAVTVQASDATGNTSGAVPTSATTDPPDSTDPSDPSGLNVDAVTETTVDLSWTASTDDDVVVGYIVRRDGVVVGTPSGTSYGDAGRTPNTTYDYTVQAIDASDNTSAEVPIEATTAPDTTAPSIPTGLAVTAEQTNSISLDWNASTDNIGVAEYIVYRDSAEIDRTTQTDYTDSPLATNATFSYTVEAVDTAGNPSGQTGAVEGTTSVVVETQTLVAEGATWRYLDNGSNQGTAWRATGFNDSSWQSGPAELGFGDGDEATVLQSGFITYYFRRTINIGGDVVSDAELRFKRDDAVAVYVNGVLVESNNLPNSYNYQSGATTTVPNSAENSWVTRTISSSVFSPGTNTIAVEIHNRSTSSSDITFDLTLIADVRLGGGAPDFAAAPNLAATPATPVERVASPRPRGRRAAY